MPNSKFEHATSQAKSCRVSPRTGRDTDLRILKEHTPEERKHSLRNLIVATSRDLSWTGHDLSLLLSVNAPALTVDRQIKPYRRVAFLCIGEGAMDLFD